jgi:hypothetical protein
MGIYAVRRPTQQGSSSSSLAASASPASTPPSSNFARSRSSGRRPIRAAHEMEANDRKIMGGGDGRDDRRRTIGDAVDDGGNDNNNNSNNNNKAAGGGAAASPSVGGAPSRSAATTTTTPKATAATTTTKASEHPPLLLRHHRQQRRGLLLSNPLLLRWSSRRGNNNSSNNKRYPSGRIDKEEDSIRLLDGPLGCGGGDIGAGKIDIFGDMIMNDVTASSSFSLSSSYSEMDGVLNPAGQKTMHPREWTTGRRRESGATGRWCEGGAHVSSGFGGCGASRPSTPAAAAATTTTTNRGSSRAVVSGAAPQLAPPAVLPGGHIPVLLLPSTTNLLVLPRNPSSSESHVSDLGFYDPAAQIMTTPAPAGPRRGGGGGGHDSQGAATNKAAAPGAVRAATHHHENRHVHPRGASSRQQHQDVGPIVSIRSVDEFLFGGGGGPNNRRGRNQTEEGWGGGEDTSLGIGPVLVSTALPVNDDNDNDDDWEAELSQRSVNSDRTATTQNGGVDVGRMHALLLLRQHSNKKTSGPDAAANALYRNRSKIFSRSGSAKSSGQKATQPPLQKSSCRSLRTSEAAASGEGTMASPPSTSWWKRDIELRPDPSNGRSSLRPSFLPADSKAASNRHRTSAALSAPSARLLIKVQADSWRQAVESLQALSVEDWSALGMTDDDDDDDGSSDSRRDDEEAEGSFTDDEDLRGEQHQGRTCSHGGVVPRSRPVSLLGAGLYDNDEEEESFTEPGTKTTPASDSYNANCQRQHSPQVSHRRRNYEPSAALASGPSPSSKKTCRDRVRISQGELSSPMAKKKKMAVGRGNASGLLDVLGHDSFLNSSTLVPDRPEAARSRQVVKLRFKKAAADPNQGQGGAGGQRRQRAKDDRSEISFDASASFTPGAPVRRSVNDMATHCSFPTSRELDARRRDGQQYTYQSKIMVQI